MNIVYRWFEAALPFGLVKMMHDRGELLSRGIDAPWTGCGRFGRTIYDLKKCGLDLLPPSDLQHLQNVIDIGANVGDWTAGLFWCASPNRLLLIEPIPKSFTRIQERFGNMSSIKAVQCLLSDQPGTGEIYETTGSSNCSVLKPEAAMNEVFADYPVPGWDVVGKVTVPKETLDRLAADWPTIDLIKLDVQGYEPVVLSGAKNTLARTRYLLIEVSYFRQYENAVTFANLHQLLTDSFGFELVNLSQPLVIRDRAIFSDALYRNTKL